MKVTNSLRYSFFLVFLLSLVSCKGARSLDSSSNLKDQTFQNLDYLSRELGSGFDSVKNKKLAPCVDLSNIRYSGSSESNLEVLNDATTEDLLDETSVGLFAGLNLFGLVKAKVSGDIITSMANTDHSGSMIYKFEVSGKQANVNDLKMNAHGMDVYRKNNPLYFRENCGDQFVHQVAVGGKLFVAVRFTFTSKEDKEKLLVQLKGSALWGLIKWQKKWTKEEADLLKNVRISIVAVQIGGDVQKLEELKSGIYQGSCGTDDIAKCENSLDRLVKYGREEFSQQLGDLRVSNDPHKGPAILAVKLASFKDVQIKSTDDSQILRIDVDSGLSPGRSAADSLSRLLRVELELNTEISRAHELKQFKLSHEESIQVSSSLEKMNQVLGQVSPLRNFCMEALNDPSKALGCAQRTAALQKHASESSAPVNLSSRH